MRVFVPDEAVALRPWVDAGVLGAPEVHSAAVIARHLAGSSTLWADERVVLAAALAVWAPLHGHACIDLDSVAATVATDLAVAGAEDAEPVGTTPPVPRWPDPKAWRNALRASEAVRVVGGVDADPVLDDRPLVLHGTRLYTQRQWIDEGVVASSLRSRVGAPPTSASAAAIATLDALLPAAAHGSNSQHAAASAALRSRLSVIAGGPGTGKTYTVACLLAALVAGAREDRPLRIGLAAPTGKAAGRMTEAIAGVAAQALHQAGLDPDAVERLASLQAVTVHRLLGPRPDHRTRFVHHSGNRLPHDVVVIDETSMIALPMMARLLEAVPDECRLVLVGDPDQLTSIEAGAVLGDLVRAAEAPGSSLHGIVTRLTTPHRTGGTSPLGPLAEEIRRGHADKVIALLRAGDDGGRLTFVEVEDGWDGPGGRWPPAAAMAAVSDAVIDTLAAARVAAQRGDGVTALGLAGNVRILCAHRRGPAGVATWNQHAQSWLLGDGHPRRDFSGRLVLATRNDPRTGIANGEPGILVRMPRSDAEPGPLRAVFRRGASVRDFAPAELDELDTAFAMTIHKSQGSEYESVVLVHPPSTSPLVTRELLYTAVTRASRQLMVVASAASIHKAVGSPTTRVTGLENALR